MIIMEDIIKRCNNWKEFVDECNNMPTKKEKGDAFEDLTKLYLTTHPLYKDVFANVWLTCKD